MFIRSHRLKEFSGEKLRLEARAKISWFDDAEINLEFHLLGDLSEYEFPPQMTRPHRAAELWKKTCFEGFLGFEGCSYIEINVAPSGLWNVYKFDGYRRGMKEFGDARLTSHVWETQGEYRISATLRLPRDQTLRLNRYSLNMVLLEARGNKSTFWAIRHRSEQALPDFHLPENFISLPTGHGASYPPTT